MKIVINPTYRSFYLFIKNIPIIFDIDGTLVYSDRNQLKAYSIDGYDVIVKSFKKPFFFNRIAYTFFRPSKARRSYEYAFRLLEKGVLTPAPIAYIEEKSWGLLNRSYYVSIFEKNSEHIRLYMLGEKKDDAFIPELAAFIFSLHSKGVYFMDMSPGNILQRKEQDKFRFSLIDINRMKFKSGLLPQEQYASFKKMPMHPDVIDAFAHEYARCSGLDENKIKAKIKIDI